MAMLSAQPFQALLATITTTAAAAASVPAPSTSSAKNDPAAIGPIRQCSLVSDKMRKLTLFIEWLEEAENRMDYIDVTNDKKKDHIAQDVGWFRYHQAYQAGEVSSQHQNRTNN